MKELISMDAKTIFWLCVTAYYAVLAVKLVRSLLAKRESRKLARMSRAERLSYRKYWRWCY